VTDDLRDREATVSPRGAGTRFATLRRTATEFSQDNGTLFAAALTYYGLLAFFPALLALVAIVGFFFDPQTVTRNLEDIVGQLGPASAVDTLRGPIESVTSSPRSSGILIIVGLAISLWSASGYIGAFTKVSNVVWEVEEGRPFYWVRPLQVLVTLIQVILLALVVVGVVVTGPVAQAVGNTLGIGSAAVTAWNILKWPVMLAVVFFCIALLYYASPNARQRGGFRWVFPGAILAVVVWLVASVAFAFYVGHFGSYNKTYGSLGGIVCFLVWYWITNVAVVLGLEFNAERERTVELQHGIAQAEEQLQVEPRRSRAAH
jgi:membrane protein